MKLRATLALTALLFSVAATHAQQAADAQSCAGKMTEQLRRFSEQCLSALVSYVASQPKTVARVMGEKAKFYVQLSRTPQGLEAEAASRANFPLMTTETADTLKRLGWKPPETEEGNFTKRFDTDAPAPTVENLAQTLAAYGLANGEAMSLTVAVPE